MGLSKFRRALNQPLSSNLIIGKLELNLKTLIFNLFRAKTLFFRYFLRPDYSIKGFFDPFQESISSLNCIYETVFPRYTLILSGFRRVSSFWLINFIFNFLLFLQIKFQSNLKRLKFVFLLYSYNPPDLHSLFPKIHQIWRHATASSIFCVFGKSFFLRKVKNLNFWELWFFVQKKTSKSLRYYWLQCMHFSFWYSRVLFSTVLATWCSLFL